MTVIGTPQKRVSNKEFQEQTQLSCYRSYDQQHDCLHIKFSTFVQDIEKNAKISDDLRHGCFHVDQEESR